MKITDVILETTGAVDRSATKSPALSALLKQAYAKYPNADSDVEAYIRQDMDNQQHTDSTLTRQSNVNQDQSKYINRLQDVARKQNSKIGAIDQENDHLETELSRLGKELDAMEKDVDLPGGRKETPKDTEKKFEPTSGSVGSPSWATLPDQSASAAPEEPSPMASTARQLTAPKPPADPMAAMTDRITHGDSSVVNKVTGQTALPFEPSNNVLEPVIPQQQNPRYAAARANASDVDPRYYADVAKKIAGSPEQFAAAMGGVNENDEEPEVDYEDPKWDAMVDRVKKLAGLGPLKTVYDPEKRVYRNIPTAEQPKK